jgi:serine phosphatase RsbU (regulator of sigma subunit)
MKRIKFIIFSITFMISLSSWGSVDSLKTLLSHADDDSTELVLNVQIGWELLSQQSPDSALVFAQRAESFAKKIKDPFLAESVYKLKAFCYGDMNDRPQCLESHLYRVQILETYGEVNRELVVAYFEIASVFESQEQDSTAITYYVKCQNAAKEIEFYTAFGLSLMEMSGVKQENGDLESAKIDLLLAMPFLTETPIYHAMSISDYSDILIEQDSLEKASIYLDTALSIIEPFGEAENVAFVYQNAGKIELAKGNQNEALSYFNKALNIWEPLQKNFYLQDLYLNLAEANTSIDPSLSSYYYKKHIELRDVANSEDNNAQMADMEAKYENQKKEQEIALLSKDKELGELEKKKQSQIFTVVLIGLGLVLVLAVFLATRLRMIRKQNKLIQSQKLDLQLQKEIVEEKSRELGDSINYAMRIQNAALPQLEDLKADFKDSFIIYKAKDKLSGDFYWRGNVKNSASQDLQLIALGDCTGHGVPGALLSILGINYLNIGLSANQLKSPAEALDFLNGGIHTTFSSSEGEIRDGMDMAIVAINRQKMLMTYACAKNPIYLVRNGELKVYKGNKHAIGKDGASSEILPFDNFEVEIEKGDLVYLFSDGFADQFGGEKGKKMGYKRFKEKLLSLESESLKNQETELDTSFENWKGSLEQLDDVCLIGLKI